MKTYYEILGVVENADKPTVKAAYRRLIKQFHPDVNPQGGKIFEDISRAYSILSDPEKRREYDLKLQSGSKASGVAPKFRFREFREWLFSLSFVKTLFLRKRVASANPAPKPLEVDPAVLALDTTDLLRRVVYSNNVHVQKMAVRAIVAKDRKGMANDLLRILYSNVGEEVKLEIVQGVADLKTPLVQKVLSEVYEMERNLRVKKAIRGVVQVGA